MCSVFSIYKQNKVQMRVYMLSWGVNNVLKPPKSCQLSAELTSTNKYKINKLIISA